MSKQDYYQTLGVDHGADKNTIKRSYRRLVMKYHPDRNSGDKAAEEKFKQIQEAYEVLSDSEKREAYDRFGHDAFNGANPAGGGADFSNVFNDVFSDFFGGTRTQSQPQQRILTIQLNFTEAITGCKKELKINEPVPCSGCNGTGMAPGTRPQECSSCHGTGQIRINRGFFTLQQSCNNCGGAGKIISSPCKDCNGRGSKKASRTVSVKIPAGIQDGETIRLNIGGTSNRQYYLRTQVEPHPLFERDGDNLHISIPISIVVAALGGQVEAPTVTGGKVKIIVPPATQTGAILRLRGRGAPNPRGGIAGDMLCHIVVETPVNLTSKQEQILRDFDDSIKGKRSHHAPQEKSWLEKVKKMFSDD